VKSMALVLITAAMSSAYVADNSEHFNDALAVSSLMSGAGYTPVVQITTTSGLCNYWLLFRSDWYSADDDLAKVSSSIGAVGIVSAETTWSSEGLYIMFEDKSIYIRTADCRQIWDAVQSGEYSDEAIALAMLSVMTIMDQGLSDL
jgi:hypothetical protein